MNNGADLFEAMGALEGGVEPVVKQGGSTEISDDELAALDAGSTDTEKVQSPEKPVKKLSTESKEKPLKKEVEINNDKKPTLKEATDAANQENKVRSFKIKQGEAEIDLREDAMVPVKINGKIENVAVKDLLTEFSGKSDWNRKYQELHNEKKSFYTERDTIQTRVNDLYRLAVEEKNPRMAIEHLAESMGANPEQVWTDIISQVKKAYEQDGSEKLSPEQIQARERDQELEYYKKKEQFRRTEQEKTKSREGLISRVHSVQEQFKIPKEQFKSCYDDLVAEAAKTGFDVNNITPEMVGEYYKVVSRKDTIASFASETYGSDERLETITSQLYDAWNKNPEFTIDDIKEIALSAFPSQTKKPSKLVERAKQETKEKKVQPQHEPISWDDL